MHVCERKTKYIYRNLSIRAVNRSLRFTAQFTTAVIEAERAVVNFQCLPRFVLLKKGALIEIYTAKLRHCIKYFLRMNRNHIDQNHTNREIPVYLSPCLICLCTVRLPALICPYGVRADFFLCCFYCFATASL